MYIADTRSSSLACFARDPKTGKLTYRETLADGTGNGDLNMAAGVAISANGRYVSVAAEGGDSISIFARNAGGDR